MRCLIKNIPPLTFGIAGNRGIGFPLTDVHGILPQVLIDCFLIKEDGYTNILTDNSDFVIVDCYHPEDMCIIVLQENRNYNLLQQEENQDEEQDVIFCSWREYTGQSYEEVEGVCYLLMQEDIYLQLDVFDEVANGDRILISCPDPNPPCSVLVLVDGLSSILVDQLWKDDFYLPCYNENQNSCYLTMMSGDGTSFDFVDGDTYDFLYLDCEQPNLCFLDMGEGLLLTDNLSGGLIIPCPTPPEEICFLSTQEDDCEPLYDGRYEDQIVLEGCEEYGYRCYITVQESADIALVDENAGETLQFRCNMEALNNCHISLEENEYTPLLVPNFDEGFVLTLQCFDQNE